jgi:putative ABC transport system substrate-binding protein
MDRRTFISSVTLALLAAPLAAEAQQAEKVYRIGTLSAGPRALPEMEAVFSQALRELGWIEGKNVVFEPRYAEDRLDRLPELFARPGGNVTGVSIVTVDLGPKRLELLRAAIPGVAQVGVLWDPSFPPAAPELKEIESAARSLRVELRSVGVQRPEEFEGALLAMTSHHAAALIVVAGRIFTQHRQRLAELTTKARLPMMSYRREVAEAGGLMSYGPNYPDMDRRAATYVDKILKGAKPNDLPVEQPAKVEFVINLKTAKVLGLTIPPSLLQRADQVIE